MFLNFLFAISCLPLWGTEILLGFIYNLIGTQSSGPGISCMQDSMTDGALSYNCWTNVPWWPLVERSMSLPLTLSPQLLADKWPSKDCIQGHVWYLDLGWAGFLHPWNPSPTAVGLPNLCGYSVILRHCGMYLPNLESPHDFGFLARGEWIKWNSTF